ncbi:hypothetical protein E4U42_004543 [Claviceps africana]|uniref:Gag1-like clamp domain-containing protein n=1 Tax=Claviceps africana TaxID=83212 RepID=A0A8K0J537_9HYPO|nr:hypothetical protein E4U42_004543 [Claviceps africana]
MTTMATSDCGESMGRHTRTNDVEHRQHHQHHQHHQNRQNRQEEADADAGAGAATVQNHPIASPKECETTTRALPASPQANVTEPGLFALQLSSASHESKTSSVMIFADFYRSSRSPFSKLRMHHPHSPAHLLTSTPEWVTDEYADLLSRDKTKQKDAIKRYLSDKVRNDWDFCWPPAPHEEDSVPVMCQELTTTHTVHYNATITPTALDDPNQPCHVEEGVNQREEDIQRSETGSNLDVDETDADADADGTESVYSVVSEDAAHYRVRAEWTSDWSDVDDQEVVPTIFSPLRFENSNAVRPTVQEIFEAKKAKRRRAVREEMSWNDGLACFEARRNAWTGAKTVRLHRKPEVTPPASPRSPKRFFFRRSISGSPPGSTGPALAIVANHGGNPAAISDNSSYANKGSIKDLHKHPSTDSSASEVFHGQAYPVETIVPIGQPILPPSNPLRASISPTVYLSLYDKVILHNLQPACPVNLADMLRSCVAGWKRDGEWPPRPSAPEPMVTAARKKKRTATQSKNEQAGNVTRRMSLGLLGRDNHDEFGNAKGIRRSLQRALGIGAVGDMDG